MQLQGSVDYRPSFDHVNDVLTTGPIQFWKLLKKPIEKPGSGISSLTWFFSGGESRNRTGDARISVLPLDVYLNTYWAIFF
jgi:hypothetical protein